MVQHMGRVLIILVLGLIATTPSVWAQSQPTHINCESPIRIMPLGDSITRGSGTQDSTGYRRPLYINLASAGYMVDFVGTERDGGGSLLTFDIDHHGYSGRTAERIAAQIGGFLDATPADVILLHIGTNDLLDGQAPNQVITEIVDILDTIDQWESSNGTVTVLLAQIVNRPRLESAITTFNTQLQTMTQSRISDGDEIVLVDMENAAGLDYATNSVDFSDDIHPSPEGYQKIAQQWLRVIEGTFNWPICNVLQMEMNIPATVIQSGKTAEFSLRITNDSAKAVTNLEISTPTAPDCNRQLSDLKAGQDVQVSCKVPNVINEFLHYVTVMGQHPDERALKNQYTLYITAKLANLAPVTDLNGPIQGGGDFAFTYHEGVGTQPITAPDATISDPDQATYTGALLVPISRPDGQAETLTVDTTNTAISAIYEPATGAVRLINADSFSKYWQVLRSATYLNTSQNPTAGLRTIEISVSDGSSDQNISRTQIMVEPQNDAPQIAANNGLTTLVGKTTPLQPVHLTAVDVDDLASALIYSVVEAPQRGRLLRSGTPLDAGDTFSQSDLNGQRVRYQHTGSSPEMDSFAFIVADDEGAKTDVESLKITVAAQVPLFLPIAKR